MNKKGFTLIELLVVIAIIGILATIVLASLNSARAKANDTAVKADLANSMAAAQLYYDNAPNTYAGVCAANSSATNPGIKSMGDAAASVGGGTAYCNDTISTWVLAAPLKSTPTISWCVDSTGTSTSRTGNPTGASC